jgi:hypothetical protein
MGVSLRSFLTQGGPFMYVLAFWFVCAVALIVERWIAVGVRYRVDAPFLDRIEKLVASGNIGRAAELCRASPPKAPWPKLMRSVLTKSKPLPDALAEHAVPLRRRLPWLGSVAQAAIVFGIIGLGVEVIDTVQSVSELSGEARQAALRVGILGGFNNLLLGATIAVLCILARRILVSQTEALLRDAEGHVSRLEAALTRKRA